MWTTAQTILAKMVALALIWMINLNVFALKQRKASDVKVGNYFNMFVEEVLFENVVFWCYHNKELQNRLVLSYFYDSTM